MGRAALPSSIFCVLAAPFYVFYSDGLFFLKTGHGIQVDMPQFNLGDFVSEKAARPKRVGRVVQVYDFEDGSESPFFAFELVAEKL